MTLIPVTQLAKALTSRSVRLVLERLEARDRAVRVRQAETGVEAWLPLCAVRDHLDGTFTLPKRLAAKKGLIAHPQPEVDKQPGVR